MLKGVEMSVIPGTASLFHVLPESSPRSSRGRSAFLLCLFRVPPWKFCASPGLVLRSSQGHSAVSRGRSSVLRSGVMVLGGRSEFPRGHSGVLRKSFCSPYGVVQRSLWACSDVDSCQCRSPVLRQSFRSFKGFVSRMLGDHSVFFRVCSQS